MNVWEKINDYYIPILEEYCGNGNKKLMKLADKVILKTFPGMPQMYHADCYDAAMTALMQIAIKDSYDKHRPFEVFLEDAVRNKIITVVNKQNTQKRSGKTRDKETGKIDHESGYKIVSIDSPIDEDGEVTVGDILCSKTSDFDVHEAAFHENEQLGEGAKKYLESLSDVQREIINLTLKKVPVVEIKKRLKLSNRQYDNLWSDIRSFSKINILFGSEVPAGDLFEEEKDMKVVSQTLEKSKPGKLSVASIIKKMDKHTIRFDHPLQRESEQWTPAMKGNLISDILQDNPIPELVFAEQVVNGLAIIWDLDGKQRCTNVYSYVKGGYKISKNIRRWMIGYQAPVEEDGKQKFDANGFPVYEHKEFDIRGKHFEDLPEELQEMLLDYSFEIVQYLNCSSEDIAYHIARYNEGKPMTASQKGITRIGEEFATMVKSIARMSFFKDLGGYKVSEVKNGTLERVVVESVMAANYLNEWNKKLDEMCEYLKNNATTEDFDNFEDMVTRLEKVVTDETSDMFNSKDSFLWFGLFARFEKTGLDDIRFIDFMAEFAQSLHSKTIDGITYDDLNGKSTKDRSVITKKLNHLEILMNEFCGVEAEENVEVVSRDTNESEIIVENNVDFNDVKEDNKAVEDSSTAESSEPELEINNERLEEYLETFKKSDLMASVKDEKLARQLAFKSLMMYCDKDLEEIDLQKFINDMIIDDDKLDDVHLLQDMLDMWTLDVDNSSDLLDVHNMPELLRVVKYINDFAIDDNNVSGWLGEYSSNYINRQENSIEFYNDMIDSLNLFVEKNSKKIA